MSFASCSIAQTEKDPWTEKQLMPPDSLAEILKNPSGKIPLILNIGPSGAIKNSIAIGEGRDKETIEKLRNKLLKIPKDTSIVIYCGCCPFVNCPNIRPVFKLLTEMKFTNPKLLNLPRNLKVNWIDRDFPMN